VSLAAGEATIHFNELRISVDRLKAAVEEAGYDVDHAGPVHARRIPVTTVSP
jgi:copper chaperone CopZ